MEITDLPGFADGYDKYPLASPENGKGAEDTFMVTPKMASPEHTNGAASKISPEQIGKGGNKRGEKSLSSSPPRCHGLCLRY
mmetsp:Transcript_109619/g.310148  ORF Transcript_109619/g.310148 Transcript_109619/m.310148 type:complete len:82 (-) Transcript_109619:111-356(-)